MSPELARWTPSTDTTGSETWTVAADETDHRPLGDDCAVLRNYDGTETHRLTVRFLDGDDVAFEETHVLSPRSVVTVGAPLDPAVYRVEARVDGDSATRTDCLVGDEPDTTALVEVGNGLVSVVDGLI